MEGFIRHGTFYVVLAVILFSFRKKGAGDEGEDPLGPATSRQIKGVAILMVLLGHLAHLLGLIQMPVTSFLGAQGVELFLFLSGYGLVSSYKKKGLAGFWRKRLLTVMIPYMVFNLVKIPVCFARGYPVLPLRIVLNFLAIDVYYDTSMWYVQYILLCYIVFFVIFSIRCISLQSKIEILCTVGVLMALSSSALLGTGQPMAESYSHHLSFAAGALVCLLYSRFRTQPKKCYAVASAVWLAFFLPLSAAIPQTVAYYMANLSILLFIVPLFMLLTRCGLASRLLSALGDLGYAIYLNELVVMSILAYVLNISGPWLIPLIFAVSILLALPTKWMSDWIIGKLMNVHLPHKNSSGVA